MPKRSYYVEDLGGRRRDKTSVADLDTFRDKHRRLMNQVLRLPFEERRELRLYLELHETICAQLEPLKRSLRRLDRRIRSRNTRRGKQQTALGRTVAEQEDTKDTVRKMYFVLTEKILPAVPNMGDVPRGKRGTTMKRHARQITDGLVSLVPDLQRTKLADDIEAVLHAKRTVSSRARGVIAKVLAQHGCEVSEDWVYRIATGRARRKSSV